MDSISANDPDVPLLRRESRKTGRLVRSLDILELRRKGTVTKSGPSPGSRSCRKETVMLGFVGVDGIISSSINSEIE